MAQATWEKTGSSESVRANSPFQGERLKFFIGGLLILGAVAYLLISSTLSGARYFITVEDLLSNPEYAGKTVRITGAVDGNTIRYDSENLVIDFSLSNLPQNPPDLAAALHASVTDLNAARIPVHVEGQPMPDLLQHEAQAILTGSLDSNGVFHATELLLKCPSRFEEVSPANALANHPDV